MRHVLSALAGCVAMRCAAEKNLEDIVNMEVGGSVGPKRSSCWASRKGKKSTTAVRTAHSTLMYIDSMNNGGSSSRSPLLPSYDPRSMLRLFPLFWFGNTTGRYIQQSSGSVTRGDTRYTSYLVPGYTIIKMLHFSLDDNIILGHVTVQRTPASTAVPGIII